MRFFSKFGPHSKIYFENSTRLRHEFLETLARPEKKLQQKLTTTQKVQPGSRDQEMLLVSFTRDQKYLWTIEYGVR